MKAFTATVGQEISESECRRAFQCRYLIVFETNSYIWIKIAKNDDHVMLCDMY